MWAESGVMGVIGEGGAEFWVKVGMWAHSTLKGEEPGGVRVPPFGSGDEFAMALLPEKTKIQT